MRVSSSTIGDCTVLHLHGTLDAAATLILARSLRKAIAEQPDAVVVDLAAVAQATRSALRVFPNIARRETSWPGTVLLLAAPVPVVAEELRRGATSRWVGVHDSVSAAVEAARTSPPRLREVLHLGASPLAPGTARRFTRQTLADWGEGELLDPVLLIVSELVTNAVVHAGTDLSLALELGPRTLHIEVSDSGPTLLRVAREPDESGRGLLIVEQLAATMGSRVTPDGKLVWAVLRRGRPSAPPPPSGGTASSEW